MRRIHNRRQQPSEATQGKLEGLMVGRIVLYCRWWPRLGTVEHRIDNRTLQAGLLGKDVARIVLGLLMQKMYFINHKRKIPA